MNHQPGQPALLVNKQPKQFYFYASLFFSLRTKSVCKKEEHYKSNAQVKLKPILAARVEKGRHNNNTHTKKKKKKKKFEIKLYCAFSVYLYSPGVYRLLKVVEAFLKRTCVCVCVYMCVYVCVKYLYIYILKRLYETLNDFLWHI